MKFVMCSAFLMVTLTGSMSGGEHPCVVFSQAPDNIGGFLSDAGTVELFGIAVEVADDFVLAHDANVRSVVWYGFYPSVFGPPPETDHFTILFYEDNNGIPAAEPFAQYAVGHGVRERDVGGGFIHRADIPKTKLYGGTTYYISIVNDTSGDLGLWSWEQANTGAGGPMFYRFDFGGGFGDWTADFGSPTDPLGNRFDTAFALSTKCIAGDGGEG